VCVKCESKTKESQPLDTNIGVPQGLCISCLLFLVMINDLLFSNMNSLSICFADDNGLIISGPESSIASVVDKMNEDLSYVYNWMCSNRLNLNIDKCEFIIFGKKKQRKALSDVLICIDGVALRQVDCIKLLGVFIDNDLNFKNHCSKITKSCNGALWSLKTLRNVLSIRNKTIVVQSLVCSIFNYAAPVWLFSKHNFNEINKIIRACARFIYNKSKYDGISDNINVDLEWLVAENVVKLEMGKVVCKILNGTCPKYFDNYISEIGECSRITRSNEYVVPSMQINNGMGKRSFKYRASKFWLSLPTDMKESCKHVSFTIFKADLKQYLLNNQCTERMIDLFDIIDIFEENINL
jgi:hypothetical protein